MKKILRLLLLSSAVAAIMTCSAFAEQSNVSFVTENDGDGVVIKEISVTGDEAVDVNIPEMLDGKNVIGIDLQSMTAKQAEKIKTLSSENEDMIIHGNLFKWKYENTGITDLENDGESYYGINVPDTDTFLSSIPAFVSESYNYDSNADGTNDTYYVGKNLVRVDTDYSGNLVVKEGTVSILAGAMEGCSGLKAVTLPDSVEWIGVRAFANSGVTSVNLPKGMLKDGSKTIQMATFYGCDKLKGVSFPAGDEYKLEDIRVLAFYGCESLEGFDFTKAEKLGTLSFAKAFKEGASIDLSNTSLYEYDNANAGIFSHSGVGSVVFGNKSGNIVPFEMFRNCKSLTSVDLGSVNTIYAWGFSGCTNLKTDILASSKVQEIKYRSFADTGITEITIPETVERIDGGSFAGNEQLKTVNWKTSKWGSYNSMFGAFNDCMKGASQYYWSSFYMHDGTKPSEYTFPDTINIYAIPVNSYNECHTFLDQRYLETVNIKCEVENIPGYMFQFCPDLKSVSFDYPEKIKSIGYNAFLGCLSLNDFPFDEMTSLQEIKKYAFLLIGNSPYTSSKCNDLSKAERGYGFKEIDLSMCTNLTNIGYSAFYNQYNAEKIHMPANVVINPISIFNGAASVKELICEGNVSTDLISNNLFSSSYAYNNGYNETLEKVTIKGQIEYKGYPMFFAMKNLKEVNLPNAVSIPNNCFQQCSALETVNAPKATAVGDHAFFKSSISSVAVNKDVTYGKYVFAECNKLENVVVEEGVTELSDFMFTNCASLKYVSLPSTLTDINWAAFKNAPVEIVDIPASVTRIWDDAFSGGSKVFIFRGAPVVDLTYEGGGIRGEDPLFTIDDDATVYYVDDAAKTGAEVYKASLADENSALKIEPVPAKAQVEVSGVPSSIKVGSDLNLSNLKVKYNGVELADTQYTIDYDPKDETIGNRIVTLKITDDTILTGLLNEKAVRAYGVSGNQISGSVYTFSPESEFTVRVVKKSSSGGSSTNNTKYGVSVGTENNGDITVDTSNAAKGSKVTVTVKPDEGYDVGSLIVTDNKGNKIVVTPNGDGKYSFIMPEGSVNIEAVFVPKEDKTEQGMFSDVSTDSYYYDSVKWAVENGITQGTGEDKFSPDAECTRVQAITFLWRAAGCPAPKNRDLSFTDVDADAYYADAVLWAIENGITQGTGRSLFSPDSVCDRAQIITFIMRALGAASGNGDILFTDVDSDAYYADAVKWAVENGITQGTGDSKFSPYAECSRAQIVTFLWRAYAGK